MKTKNPDADDSTRALDDIHRQLTALEPGVRPDIRLPREIPTHTDLRTGGDQRYELVGTLGQGGMGIVHLATDRELNREVALKLSRAPDPDRLRRFLEEIQILAQLEHPNIVPLHDVGLTSTGVLYCTMRYVRGRTLADIITKLRNEDDETRQEFSVTRLVQVFLQVAQAVDYAHSRGVLHRDLKPSNVMLGAHGEVQVLDWGLALLLERSDVALAIDPESSPSRRTRAGTPAYMSPEQVRGDPLDERTDVYALGAMLYELLALQAAFSRTPSSEVAQAVLTASLRRPQELAPTREVPAELERVAMEALSRDAAQRPRNVRAVLDRVQAWLEQHTEHARRRQMATQQADEGRALLAAARAIESDLTRARAEVDRLERALANWLPVAEREVIAVARARVQDLSSELARAKSRGVRCLQQAVGFDPDHRDAPNALADHYWSELEQAERRRDTLQANQFAELVAAHHDGRYANTLVGDGSIELEVDPPDARVTLHRLLDRGFVLVADEGVELSGSPPHRAPLAMGRYLVRIEAPDRRAALYPVFIHRGRHWRGRVHMLTENAVGSAFKHVPGGPFIEGGDTGSEGWALPPGEPHVDDFCIAEYPITVAEYIEFLDAIAAVDRPLARARSPRRTPDGGFYLREVQGRFSLPTTDSDGDRWDPRMPVFSISVLDAEAYCAWRSQRDGIAFRLPTEREWEKAARGVDGRVFPWGDTFDPSLANIRGSLRERTALVRVDEFPTDVSVYGVRGLAGNIREWTATEMENDGRVLRIVRGGSFDGTALGARAPHRRPIPPTAILNAGFRLVHVSKV